jgi:hypothetical protein
MNIKNLDFPFSISPSTPFMELHLHEVGMKDHSQVVFVAMDEVDCYKKVTVRFESAIDGVGLD